MTGFIMKDKARFQSTGLLPADLPHFLHGYSRNNLLWLYEQPSDYYRRHLLLHEGTHGFMNTVLGGCGPPWYMEGMAELLATHRLADGRLTLNSMPANRDEVPEWGRIRIIKDAVAAGRGVTVAGVVGLPAQEFLNNDSYAWSWAWPRSSSAIPATTTAFANSTRRFPPTRSRRGSTGSFSPTGGN